MIFTKNTILISFLLTKSELMRSLDDICIGHMRKDTRWKLRKPYTFHEYSKKAKMPWFSFLNFICFSYRMGCFAFAFI